MKIKVKNLFKNINLRKCVSLLNPISNPSPHHCIHSGVCFNSNQNQMVIHNRPLNLLIKRLYFLGIYDIKIATKHATNTQ